jgi:hypothetical protein
VVAALPSTTDGANDAVAKVVVAAPPSTTGSGPESLGKEGAVATAPEKVTAPPSSTSDYPGNASGAASTAPENVAAPTPCQSKKEHNNKMFQIQLILLWKRKLLLLLPHKQ